MNRAEIVDVLRGLTHKPFVELFYEAVADRFIYNGEEMLWEARTLCVDKVCQ